MVAICHNMDLGDAWEWADQPELSGKVRVHGVQNRNQLHHLRDDPLKMFELFFKYPIEAFSRGDVVLLGRWPVWLLGVLLLIGAGAFAWPLLRNRRLDARPLVVWALQTATLGMLLLMLWQPALSVSTLRPQQNIVAVIADDSRSMSLTD